MKATLIIIFIGVIVGGTLGFIIWLLVMSRKDHVSRGFDDEGKYLGRGKEDAT